MSPYTWKKRLLVFIPTFLLFAMPWIHWLIFQNLIMVFPDLPSEPGHWLAVGMAIAAAYATGAIIYLR